MFGSVGFSYNATMTNSDETARPSRNGLSSDERRGVVAGVFCYLLWGLMPIYWKLLDEVDSLEIIAQRIIWCFVTTIIFCFSSVSFLVR